MVLRDQLPHMRDHQDAFLFPLLAYLADEFGCYHAFPAACRHHHKGVAVVLFEVMVDAVDRGPLVVS